MSYPLHPAVEIFPVMDELSFANLAEDIRVNGQHEPILLWRGQVIDGRHRLRACNELGIMPKVREVDADHDPVGLVLSLNLHRRHLNESQRAMVAAKLANMKAGDNQHKVVGQICTTSPSISNASAAEMLNVSKR